jgi:hypothetical protein
MMTQAIQAHPELLNIIGDLYFGSMDWAKARQIADRLKKVIPQAQDDDQGDDPAVLQAKLGQAQQQLVEQRMLLQKAAEDIRTDKIKAQHQKEIALLEAKVELIKLRVELAAKQRETEMKMEAAEHQAELKFFADERAHQRDLESQGEQQQRQIDADDRRHRMTLVAGRDQQESDRSLHVADAILDAELATIEADRQEAEQDRIRSEQRDDMREQRAFEAQQANQSPPPPTGGAA